MGQNGGPAGLHDHEFMKMTPGLRNANRAEAIMEGAQSFMDNTIQVPKT